MLSLLQLHDICDKLEREIFTDGWSIRYSLKNQGIIPGTDKYFRLAKFHRYQDIQKRYNIKIFGEKSYQRRLDGQTNRRKTPRESVLKDEATRDWCADIIDHEIRVNTASFNCAVSKTGFNACTKSVLDWLMTSDKIASARKYAAERAQRNQKFHNKMAWY